MNTQAMEHFVEKVEKFEKRLEGFFMSSFSLFFLSFRFSIFQNHRFKQTHRGLEALFFGIIDSINRNAGIDINRNAGIVGV